MACADFDNDGDQDLYETAGANRGEGSIPNNFFVRSGESLHESAEQYDVESPLGRGRHPIWFDYDADGDLDLFIFNAARDDGLGRSSLFRNDGEAFHDATEQTGFDLRAMQSVGGILSDISGDGDLELLVFNTLGEFNPVVFTATDSRLFDRSQALGIGRLPYGVGALSKDFNNDLVPDLLITKYRTSAPEVIRRADDTLLAYLPGPSAPEFEFSAEGKVHFEIWVGLDNVGVYCRWRPN